jgi:hypothetical protein
MRIRLRRAGGRIATIVLTAALFIAGCGLLEESPPAAMPTPSPANLLIDPGFETTNPPAWRWANAFVASAFEPTTSIVRSGTRSAELSTDGTGAGTKNAAVQTVNTTEVPEFISGYYFVSDWPDGDAAYLQVTVRAGPGFEPVRAIRLLLAGADREPEPAPPDVRYVFLSRDAPITREWTYFAYPIRQAFIDRGWAVPSGFVSLDVTLEIHPNSVQPRVVVFYDDVYLGPQAGNPNRPKEKRE